MRFIRQMCDEEPHLLFLVVFAGYLAACESVVLFDEYTST